MLKLTEFSYCCFLAKVYDMDKNKFNHDICVLSGKFYKVADDVRDMLIQNYFGLNHFLFKQINDSAIRIF